MRFFLRVLWWWVGRQKRMRDREEQVNCDIYKSALQNEASYDNAVK